MSADNETCVVHGGGWCFSFCFCEGYRDISAAGVFAAGRLVAALAQPHH